MTEPDESRQVDATEDATRPTGLLRRHPRLGILLIAGLFYAILLAMAVFVFLLLARG